jgi:hypothetical protein
VTVRPSVVWLLAVCALGCVDLSRPHVLTLAPDAAGLLLDGARSVVPDAGAPSPRPADAGMPPPVSDGGADPGGDQDAPAADNDGPTTAPDAARPVDAPTPADGPLPVDAPPPRLDAPMVPPCTPLRRWRADFSSDPTKLDVDSDGVLDWAQRNGAAFSTAELANGIWTPATGNPLDTRPLYDFDERTVVQLRFKSLAPPSQELGGVFWINVGNGQAQAAAVVASVAKFAGGQKVTIYGKPGANLSKLGSIVSGGDNFAEVTLDIEPRMGIVTAILGGTSASWAFPKTGPSPITERAATVQSWPGGGGAQFDEVVITTCKP